MQKVKAFCETCERRLYLHLYRDTKTKLACYAEDVLPNGERRFLCQACTHVAYTTQKKSFAIQDMQAPV